MIKINESTKSKSFNSVNNYTICWYIQLLNGEQLRFTNHDSDITVEGRTYVADAAFTYKSVAKNSELSKEDNEIFGIINDKYFKQEDIINGKLDNVYIEIFLVSASDLDGNKLIINQGYINNIKITDNKFVANISSIQNKLNKKITHSFSQRCRAQFCDKKCTLQEDNYTFHGEITALVSHNIFNDSKRNEENFYFNFGKITFLSGTNSGLCFQIKNFIDNKIELILPRTNRLEIGDRYSIIAGCDKYFSSCINKFNNALNFRGEPYISKVLTGL
jgi:uncharacterized phage protein (TIGR02218 family)